MSIYEEIREAGCQICQICGKIFIPRNKLHKNCSRECRKVSLQQLNREWRKKHPERVKEREHRRYKRNLEERRQRSRDFRRYHPEKIKFWRRRHYENNIEYFKKYEHLRTIPGTKEYIRDRCRNKTEAAIASGKLKRGPCSNCGIKNNIQAHHEDYSKPYDVIWLCRKCHSNKHSKERMKY